MLIKKLKDLEKFTAGDGCELREHFHPEKDKVQCRYSLAHATVKPGQVTALHRLKKSSEVYYIIRGEGIMHVDEEAAVVGPGDAIVIPPGAKQYIENARAGDLEFICIVDPPWRLEDEQIL